jgi:hypothetical protein
MSKHTPEGLKAATSPFLENLVIPTIALYKVEARIDPTNIKVADGVINSVGIVDQVKKTFVVEKDRRINLYYENNGVDLRPYYSKLSKEGRMLLDYLLLYCLREDKLHCYIDSQEFMKIYGVSSRTTIWNSKKNLVDIGFIAATSYTGWYWINPKFFFKGERLKCDALKDNREI